MKIIMPIGISGSGKTRLYKMRYSDLTLVSPDLIRKEMTGDISDQSKNREVFQEVDRRVKELVRNDESFFYDATNLNPDLRKRFVNKFRGKDNIKIVYVVLPADMMVSRQRIMDDLGNKVERAKVPSEVLARQYGMYRSSIKSKFEGENVQEIIYIQPGELD